MIPHNATACKHQRGEGQQRDRESRLHASQGLVLALSLRVFEIDRRVFFLDQQNGEIEKGQSG